MRIVPTVIFALLALTASPAVADYDPERCKLVDGTLDIHWERKAGGEPCATIETTNGTPEDAEDGSVVMGGTDSSDPGCLGTRSYELELSAHGRALTVTVMDSGASFVLYREPGEGCFHGNLIEGDVDFVAHIAGDVFAAGAAPVCGDVNDNGAVNASDALLVLRKGVGQDVEIACNRYEIRQDNCQFDLASTTCGDGVLDTGEECDFGTLGGKQCTSLPGGFAGGTLACAAGCVFNSNGCTCGAGKERYGAGCVDDPCDPEPCAHGICLQDLPSDFYCSCDDQWEGTLCDECVGPTPCSGDRESYYLSRFLFCAGPEGFICQGGPNSGCESYCESWMGCAGDLQVNQAGWGTVTGSEDSECF